MLRKASPLKTTAMVLFNVLLRSLIWGGAQGLAERQFDHENGPEDVNHLYHYSSSEDGSRSPEMTPHPERLQREITLLERHR